MYDSDFDFAHFAFSPRTGCVFALDELPILHSVAVVVRRKSENWFSFRFSDPRCGVELQNLIRMRFPADLETLWKYDKVFMLVDYLGCPILCCCTLIDNFMKKSKTIKQTKMTMPTTSRVRR